MHPSNGIDIPRDRPGKLALVEALLTGRKTVDQVIGDTISVKLNIHPTEEDRFLFDANRAAQDEWRTDGSIVYFTIDFNQ